MPKGQIIAVALLVAHLLPVWVFTYIPTQDGASHIYNSYVLKEYHKHENYRLREVYELNLTLFPQLGRPTRRWRRSCISSRPLSARRYSSLLCIGLLPLSLFYFLHGIRKGGTFFALVGFIYAYNYLLHMGFYNFVLSMSLFFFTLGYWWRQKDKLSLENIGVVYALLIATYLTHYQSYAMLVMSLTFFAVFLSLYETAHRTWGYKGNGKTLASSLKRFAVTLKPTGLFLVSMLPAYFIMFAYFLDRPRRAGRHRGFEWLMEYFLSMKSLVSFRDVHILIGQALLVVFAVAFLLTAHRKSPARLRIPQEVGIGEFKRTPMDPNCDPKRSLSADGDCLHSNVLHFSLERLRRRTGLTTGSISTSFWRFSRFSASVFTSTQGMRSAGSS